VLDAVVFAVPPDEEERWGLLAAGTAVVVTSGSKPPDGWPWRRIGSAWVLAPQVSGPSGAVDPRAYDPAYSLRPGQPAPVRRRLVFVGAAVAILVLAVTLWRSRYAAAGVVALCVAAAAALAAWGGPAMSAPRRGVGAVVVIGPSDFAQVDEWTYVKALRRQAATQPWTGDFMRPVLVSPRHAARVDLRLHCDAAGPRRFTWRAEPGAPMAFLSRTVARDVSTLEPADAPSPLRDLARRAYLSPGDTLGEDVWLAPSAEPSAWDQTWPSVVVRRTETKPGSGRPG
jgi:hypothetical protein